MRSIEQNGVQLVLNIFCIVDASVEDAIELRELLALLDDEERETLLLFCLAGLSIEELSIDRLCSESAMKKRLERIKRKARGYLDEQAPTGKQAEAINDLINEVERAFDAYNVRDQRRRVKAVMNE